ncbi:MAG: hypothetical protein IJW23_07260 [Lentisphaeria bacterium]|nr:hypothetical protein [Lentisphaeria bacterium]
MGKNSDIGFFADEYPEKLIFNGNEVKIPEIFFRYAAVSAVFRPKMLETYNAMLRNFDDRIGSLDEFVEYGVSWVRNELSPLLAFTMEQLALNGCYSISEDEFYQKYVLNKLSDIPEVYNQMEAALDEMNAQQQAKNERRVEERHFKSAIGEGDDLGLMMLNGLKRLGDGVVNTGKAALIYNDDVKKKIKDEFYYLCNSMVDSFAAALYDTEKLDLRDPVSIEDFRRVKAVLKNIVENKIPESRVDGAALEIFEKYPYNAELIEWALGRYGDEAGEFQKIADAFRIDLSKKKNELIQKYFKAIDFSTEESTLKGAEKYYAGEKALSWKNEENKAFIEKKLKEFDVKARTFDGVEYETRELAAKAAELSAFYSKLDFYTEENMLKSQKLLAEKEAEIGFTNKKLEQNIIDMLNSFDMNARTCNGVEYATREEAENARKQEDRLKIVVDSCDFNSSESIQKVIDDIKKLGFTIPSSAKVIERLQSRLEILKFIPVKNMEYLRLLMDVKVKTVIVFAFLIGIYATVDSARLLAIIFFLLIVCVLMATRKRLIGFVETSIRQKNYKRAAFCSEITSQTKDEFLSGIFDK